MGKSAELLFGENRATAVERPANTLEKMRQKLAAQIFAIDYKDE